MTIESYIVCGAFVVLLGMFGKKAKAALCNTLDGYILHVTKSLKEAEDIKAKAVHLFEYAKAEAEDAAKNAAKIIDSANMEAAAIISDANEKAVEIIHRKSEATIQNLLQYEKNIVDAIKADIIQHARHKVEDFLNKGLEETAQMRILNHHLDDLKKLMH